MAPSGRSRRGRPYDEALLGARRRVPASPRASSPTAWSAERRPSSCSSAERGSDEPAALRGDAIGPAAVSYILDALRKAERERRVSPVPDAGRRARRARRGPPPAGVALGGHRRARRERGRASTAFGASGRPALRTGPAGPGAGVPGRRSRVPAKTAPSPASPHGLPLVGARSTQGPGQAPVAPARRPGSRAHRAARRRRPRPGSGEGAGCPAAPRMAPERRRCRGRAGPRSPSPARRRRAAPSVRRRSRRAAPRRARPAPEAPVLPAARAAPASAPRPSARSGSGVPPAAVALAPRPRPPPARAAGGPDGAGARWRLTLDVLVYSDAAGGAARLHQRTEVRRGPGGERGDRRRADHAGRGDPAARGPADRAAAEAQSVHAPGSP